MSIDFQPFVRDAASGDWRLPDAARENSEAFEMNRANANAVDLLLALGLAPEPVGEPMPIDAFAGLVTAALRRHLGRRSPALETVTQAGDAHATFVFCGRREGYIEDRLGDLARHVQRCRAAGATHIGWD